MARMKFLCDADRCIECNACVTACKNEHDVPWGINRRRVVTINDGKPGERSVSMACMHCTDAPCAAVCPVNCFYTTADGVVLHSKDLCIGCGYCFYACPFGAPQYPRVGNFGSRGKMDKCTYCAGGPEADLSPAEYGSRENGQFTATAPTAWPRESCRCALRCARPNRCWLATATSSRRSTRSAWCGVATRRGPGVGKRPIARRSRPEDRVVRRREPTRRFDRLGCGAETLGDDGMAMMRMPLRFLIATLALGMVMAFTAPAMAQQPKQPTEVNPTAQSVKERELLKELTRSRAAARCRTRGRACWSSPLVAIGASSIR